jgi:hypothetical protein
MDTTTLTPPTAVKKKKVSFSQFQNWYNCRHRWYLDNVMGFKKFEDSVNTCFGTAIHEAIQLYIETLYKKGVKDAAEHDLFEIFKVAFKRELEKAKENNGKGKNPDSKTPVGFVPFDYTTEQFAEFVCDGTDILNAFLNVTNRLKYFPTGKYEFIAVEDEIVMPIKNNVEFICYIDVVLKEKASGRYRIIDIKTSTTGWNKYQMENPSKTAQILLYKAFFSRKYNVSIDMIDVEFFILKRRLYENYAFPQSRIQTFTPNNNQRAVAGVLNVFSEFVTECFQLDGTFISDPKGYIKTPGKAKKNCKYCPHKKVNCDAKSDVPKDEE